MFGAGAAFGTLGAGAFGGAIGALALETLAVEAAGPSCAAFGCASFAMVCCIALARESEVFCMYWLWFFCSLA